MIVYHSIVQTEKTCNAITHKLDFFCGQLLIASYLSSEATNNADDCCMSVSTSLKVCLDLWLYVGWKGFSFV